MSDWFNHQEFERLRLAHGVTWGRPVRAYESLGSTNDAALEAFSEGALTGIVFTAREQTKGRGRRGNVWSAAPGECLMLSTLVRYQGPLGRLAGVSLVVGLSLRDVVLEVFGEERRSKAEVLVKWPNDIIVEGKKLAGILVETRTESPLDYGIVIGVGLNTSCREFPLELRNVATSLVQLGVSPSDCTPEFLLVLFLNSLETRLPHFLKFGIASSTSELRACDYLKGKSLRVGPHTGRGAGLDDEGRLLLLQENGEMIPVASGHVELADSAEH